jgi:hypothetical protein
MAKENQSVQDRPLQSARVILCEGADEYDILVWLREQRKLCEADVEIQNVNGRTKLLKGLGDLRYQSGGSDVRLVYVVLDAEERAGNDQKLLIDLQAEATKFAFTLEIFELPDTVRTGSMETLARDALDTTSKPYQCAEAWHHCLSSSSDARTQAQKDKAWTHVWLAGCGEFYSRLGFAFKSSPDVRAKLSALHQRFEALLQAVLNHPLP